MTRMTRRRADLETLGACALAIVMLGGCDDVNDWGDPPQWSDDTGGEDVNDGYDDASRADRVAACTISETQPCYPVALELEHGGVGECLYGVQTCESRDEFPTWGECIGAVLPVDEVCGDDLDNDCDGETDEEGCAGTVIVDVDLEGDCLSVTCPSEAPYPIGCDISMAGADARGCVASQPLESVVYFQEGNDCGAGHLSGHLVCSSEPGDPLDSASCPINKATQLYQEDPDACPE